MWNTSFCILVDGGWSDFSSITWTGDCSTTCDFGIESGTKTRSCTNPSPAYGGKPCLGYSSATETRECKLKECPSNVVFIYLVIIINDLNVMQLCPLQKTKAAYSYTVVIMLIVILTIWYPLNELPLLGRCELAHCVQCVCVLVVLTFFGIHRQPFMPIFKYFARELQFYVYYQ